MKKGKTDQRTPQKAPADSGIKIAEEVLSTFDKCVAEVADLAKNKPESAELTPKVEAIYAQYRELMVELNKKYLALKGQDIREFGAANSYIGEHRGRHVFNKDNVLGGIVAYYNFQKGDQAIVDLLSKKVVELLDVALIH